MNNLDALLAPRSVAVIGASNDATRIGGRTLKLLYDSGYAGPVYPVNPTRDEIQGHKAYRSIVDVPAPVDCAVVTIPAALVIDVVRECASVGVRAAVIFAGGFAEKAGDGEKMQAELSEIARATGIRLLGPNCIGLYNSFSRAYQTFYLGVQLEYVSGKKIGIVTQSGGYGAYVLGLVASRKLAVTHWITTGNECDVEFGEMLAELAADPKVDILVGYIEGLRSRENIRRAFDLAKRRRKPVILMKTGHTAAGAQAAASHTASIAGADAAYDALFDAYGVYRAGSMEEVLDIAYAVAAGPACDSDNVGVLTNSGGMGVQIADFASSAGLKLAPLPAATQQKIESYVPGGSGRNPIDVTAQWVNDPMLIKRCIDAAFESMRFSTFLLFFGSGANLKVREIVTEAVRTHPECTFVMCFVHHDEHVAFYQSIGCLVFEEPARAIRAIKGLEFFKERFARPDDMRAEHKQSMPSLRAGDKFSEHAAKNILKQSGVAILSEAIAATPAEAAEAVAGIARPVAIKIVSPDILHKTEAGGVVLNLEGASAVRAAAEQMIARVTEKYPDARIEGILISPMMSGGVECIVGVHRDATLGLMLMVGMGGVAVELLKDVAWSVLPVGRDRAKSMLQSLKLFPLLDGYRGQPRKDVAALIDAIVAISQLAEANADVLETIEVNPVYVLSEGQGAVALDAIISTRNTA